MLSTAGSSTPPPSPRDQAQVPVWPALRGDPIPEALLHDRAWLDPPRRDRWPDALRRLVARRDRQVAAPAAPAGRAVTAPAAPDAVPPDEVDRPTQEAA